MIRALAVLLLCIPSCGEGNPAQTTDDAPPETTSASQEMRMWSGGLESGPYILVEELDRPATGKASIGGEEGLFRRTFSLPEDFGLLRVHIVHDDQSAGLGEVRIGQTIFKPLGDPPEDADSRARLYWYSVTRGVQEFQENADSIKLVSHLVSAEHASPVGEPAKLQWRRGDLRIDLVARTWTGPQRRSFLEAPADFPDE